MKSLAFLVLSLTAVIAPLTAAEDAKLAAFKGTLETALRQKDLKLLNTLFYTKGASQYQIDMAVYPSELGWKGYTLEKIEFKAIDDPACAPYLEPDVTTINGPPYTRNLKPAWWCLISSKQEGGTTTSTRFARVGLAPDGSYKFPVLVAQE